MCPCCVWGTFGYVSSVIVPVMIVVCPVRSWSAVRRASLWPDTLVASFFLSGCIMAAPQSSRWTGYCFFPN